MLFTRFCRVRSRDVGQESCSWENSQVGSTQTHLSGWEALVRGHQQRGVSRSKANLQNQPGMWGLTSGPPGWASAPLSSQEWESVPATLTENSKLNFAFKEGHSGTSLPGFWPLISLHSPCISSDPISQRFLVKRYNCLISPGNEGKPGRTPR